jgi:hypothetical protein
MTTIQTNPLRNAATPFTIPLGRNDYYLTREAFYNAIDKNIARTKGYLFKFTPAHFKNGQLKLKATDEKKTYELIIGIENDKLHIACNCNTQVQTICTHAFKVLNSLASFNGTDYFRQFRPGGLWETATAHPKLFTRAKNLGKEEMEPKRSLGTVYSLNDKHDFGRISSILSQRKTQKQNLTHAPCYMVVHFYRKEHPPFVVPCMGRLNLAGTAIKNYLPFLTSVQNEWRLQLTEEQKLLNEHCLELYKEAEKLTGIFFPPGEEAADINSFAAYFSCWQKLLPLLRTQPHVFSYLMYFKKELRSKPAKKRIKQITLSAYSPRIFFQLQNKRELFQLSMKAAAAGKQIHNYSLFISFFLHDNKNDLYLYASPYDAFVAEWIRRTGSHITIFREHFKDFEKNFLSHLQLHYEVTKTNNLSKDKTTKKQ